jgi:hypothetical protein
VSKQQASNTGQQAKLAQNNFLDKHRALATALGITEISNLETHSHELIGSAKNAAAVMCEGILHYALNHKIKKSAETLIAQQLQYIAGEYVDESSIHPLLLAAARAMAA